MADRDQVKRSPPPRPTADTDARRSPVSTAVGLPLYPDTGLQPSPKYEEFLHVRERLLDLIRDDSDQKTPAVEDVVDTLLAHDHSLPTGILGLVQNIVLLGKAYRDRMRKREVYRLVVRSLLEQVFDPALEFRMTDKDIRDAFDANGIERDKVLDSQIGHIYATVLNRLRTGVLRDLTYGELLHRYVRTKLAEITYSREDWELNHR